MIFKKINRNRNKVKLMFFLFILSGFAFSQNAWFHYPWTHENITNNYQLLRETYQYDLKKYKNNPNLKADYREFARAATLYLVDDLRRGKIYQSFSGLEEYVKRVLRVIVKDTAITNRIRIFIYRDDEFNASMS